VLLADHSSQPISALKIGDRIRSGEHREDIAVVKSVYTLESASLCRLSLTGARGQSLPDLLATDEHLLWVDGRGWVAVGKLKPGDWLLNSHGARVRVVAKQAVPGEHQVYTLKLAGDSAFYADDVLVHDLCGPLPNPVITAARPTEVAQ
jgi:hypothetical protein